ncbi:MAG: CAP domain-containing protein [Anaerolineales bacterium]
MNMRKIISRLLVLIVPVFLLWVASDHSIPHTAFGKDAQRGDGYQVIALVNQVRASYGLGALQANAALMSAAQGHSNYQASVGSLTHTGEGGSSPLSRAMAAGYGGGAKVYVSENIYGGNDASPSQAVSWWQSDSLHLQTMINPNAVDAGAGVASAGSMVYYTLDVGYVAGQASDGGTAAPVVSGTRPPTAVPIIPIQTATPNADGSIVHVVQSGQALWNIAAAYKIPLADLLSINGLTSDSLIYPGQKILVKKGAEVTATNAVTQTPKTTSSPTQTQVLIPLNTTVPGAYTSFTDTPQMLKTEVVSREKNGASKTDPIRWLILGLFLVGGALILIGSLAKPRI